MDESLTDMLEREHQEIDAGIEAFLEGLSHGEFFLTWDNVVVETRKDGVRAEGFASLLPSGDAQARETFQALGVRLDLFPPLVRSVILNGGYRCASNHVREL